MPHSMRLSLALAALCGLTLVACSDDPASPTQPTTRIVNGTPVNVGGGTATPYVTVDASNQPVAYGVRLTEGALSNLPDDAPATEYLLPMPTAGAATGIDHISLDYNPHGHDPEGIYTHEHFDIHFYYVSNAQRDSIPMGPDMTPIDPRYIPTDYVTFDHFSVPRMGVHYIDTTAAELHGHHFDKTFIYGFAGGRLTFLEPMITLDYLESKPNVTVPVKQPAAWQRTGISYPTKYSVRYDPATKQTVIEMLGLVRR